MPGSEREKKLRIEGLLGIGTNLTKRARLNVIFHDYATKIRETEPELDTGVEESHEYDALDLMLADLRRVRAAQSLPADGEVKLESLPKRS